MTKILGKTELQEAIDKLNRRLWEWEEKHEILRKEVMEIFEEFSELILPPLLAYYEQQKDEEVSER